jgi:hypothetical protein
MKTAILTLLGLFAFPVMAATTTISASGLVGMLVWIIVIGVIFGLLWWLIGYIGLPQPFDKVARVVLAVVAVLILINFLLGLMGSPVVSFR